MWICVHDVDGEAAQRFRGTAITRRMPPQNHLRISFNMASAKALPIGAMILAAPR